jgi:nucleoid-associated protein YgaU
MTYCPLTPDWQNGEDALPEARPATSEPANFIFIDVLPSDTLADIARRAYGTNNVINRLKIELANNGNITGTIRIPK